MSKMKGRDPDRGPPMKWGAHEFDKGYTSDNENIAKGFPGSGERGNRYMQMQNEAVYKDSKKLYRSKFSKIA